MVYKKRPSKKSRRRKKVQISKKFEKELDTMLNKKLDAAKEDKYLVDAVPHQLRFVDANNDAVNNLYLKEITPTIPKGDSVNDRIGNSVYLKYMSLNVMMQGHNYSGSVAQGSANGTNLVPFRNPVKIHICKVRAGLGGVLNSPPEAQDFLAKFRRQGVWPQDLIQVTDKQTIRHSIIKLKTLTMVPTYRTAFGNVETGSPPVVEMCIYSIPQDTFASCHVPIKQKWLINDNSSETALFNRPMKWRYFLYIDYCHEDWRTGYDRTHLEMPNIDFRLRWVFEDA